MEFKNKYALGAVRIDPKDSLDDYPTPPWATRALLEHVIYVNKNSCWEPACGRGHMSKVLKEYFYDVLSSDIFDYGYGETFDFLGSNPEDHKGIDFIITNPPFQYGEKFIEHSLKIARVGVAMLTRTSFIEGKGRYERLFSVNPPTYVAQFVERVPMVKARLDKKASTATSYCWLVWIKSRNSTLATNLVWIPPCRKELEKSEDYDLPKDIRNVSSID